MSTIAYVEHEGQRIEVGLDGLKTDVRCDGCGEFISESDNVRGSIETTLMDRPILFDAHPAHVGAAIVTIGRAIGERDA